MFKANYHFKTPYLVKVLFTSLFIFLFLLVSSPSVNASSTAPSNLRDIKLADILDYSTGGEGILNLLEINMYSMRDLLIDSTSSLRYVRNLENAYIDENSITVRTPITTETNRISRTGMEIVGTALNVEADDSDALRLEFENGKSRSHSDLSRVLGEDVKRSSSIDISIASGSLSGDELSFPITITMYPPSDLSSSDLYIIHYFDDRSDDYEIIKPREHSSGTITFSFTELGNFVFASTSYDTNSNQVDKDSSWGKDPKGWYYTDERGFHPNTTWKKISGKWFYFDENGYMETGWLESEHNWYYLFSSGEMGTGWVYTGGKWYFLNPSGDMATGWKYTGGKWYFLNPSGDMATGWKLTGGKWYFLNPNGDMATGWKYTGGQWYYMYSDGHMAANTITPDGYRVNASGEWIR